MNRGIVGTTDTVGQTINRQANGQLFNLSALPKTFTTDGKTYRRMNR
jgi:hypothetical protein